MDIDIIYNENCLTGLKKLPDECIDCCVTSPPYWGLRDYGINEQIGLEETPEAYTNKLVNVFFEVKRVLKNAATLWLNLGDSYAGSGCGTNDYRTEKSRSINKSERGRGYFHTDNIKAKDLVGVPWMVAFALRADGWYLRQDIIWSKKNCMPESMTDRCTKSHEYIFLLAKSEKYYYDNEAIKTKMLCSEHDKRAREGRKRAPTELINGIRGGNETLYEYANKRSVWETTLVPFPEAHFATFPENLIVDCIKAGCPEGGIVLDPFMGAATTGLVAKKLNRHYIGFELNPEYVKMGEKRIFNEIGLFL